LRRAPVSIIFRNGAARRVRLRGGSKVAYRKLLAFAYIALALTALGCDGGNSASAAPGDGEDLSGPADQPPLNPDQPPGSTDRPPASADQPAGGPVRGGDGGDPAETACRDLCGGVGADCDGDNAASQAVRAICQSGCVLDAQERQCSTQALTAINCLAGLNGLCTEDGPSEQDEARCERALDAMDKCINGDQGQQPTTGCTQAGACVCDDDCQSCACALGEDSAVCATICG
jgi:hypothetical protein